MSVRAWTSVADAGRLDRSTLGLPAEYGLACGPAVSDRAQGAAGVGERVELDGKIRQRLGSPQPEQPVPKAGRRCGLLFEELPGGGPSTPVPPSRSRLTLTTGISPPLSPTTTSRPSGASERRLSVTRSPPTGSITMSTVAEQGSARWKKGSDGKA